MIFDTKDEQLVKETVDKQRKEDLHYFRIVNILFYIAVISIIISIILLNIYHYEYDTPMYWVCFGTISVAAFPLIFSVLYKIRIIPLRNTHKEWKKKIDEPDIIEVQQDLSLHIKIGFRGPYEMKIIRAIQPSYAFPFLIDLKGDLLKDDQIIDHSYTMIAFMKNQVLLNELLSLNQQMGAMEVYHNTVLMNILSLDSEQRNSLFVQELLDSHVFLAVHLHEDTSKHTSIFEVNEHVSLAYEVQGNNICIYSEIQEISQQSKQKYPRGFLLSFQQVLSFIMKHDSSFFETDKQGIIFNPNSQQIVFTYEQLMGIYQLGGQQHGNNRN